MDFVNTIRETFKKHQEVLLETQKMEQDITNAANVIINAYRNKNKTLWCGNGGSASDALHAVGEFIGRFKAEKMVLPAITLGAEFSTLTAIANDFHFRNVFSRGIEANGNKGDVLIAISTSGNSENVIDAVTTAKAKGIYTIGLLGRDGGELGKMVDLPIIVRSSETPRIQEMHITIIHILCDLVKGNGQEAVHADVLNNFEKIRALVIGDVMLDVWMRGEVNRVSVEADVPIVAGKEINYSLGGATNCAINVKSLGGQVDVVGVIGNDQPGVEFRKILSTNQIPDWGIFSVNDRPTTQKIRIGGLNNQVVRLDWEKTHEIDSNLVDAILFKIRNEIKNYQVIILSDYNKGLFSELLTKSIVQIARENNLPVVADIKPRNMNKFMGVTVVKPNLKEAAEMVGELSDNTDENVEKIARKIKGLLQSNIIITRGASGMSVYNNGNFLHIPAQKKEVFDIAGAGDTTTAALALALASGASLEKAAQIANAAAGIAVSKRGTTAVPLKELIYDLQNQVA